MKRAAPRGAVVISPEIALVDPDLAAEARDALRPPGDCLAPRDATGAVDGSPPERRPSLRVAVVSLLVASLVGVPRAWASPAAPGGAGRSVSPAAAGLTYA